jgi:hypothetical protein
MSMSDSDTSLDGASASQGASSTYLLGYCHQCDRQVPLNPETFTCNVCSSGFVEILDETPIQAAAQSSQRAHPRGRTSHSVCNFIILPYQYKSSYDIFLVKKRVLNLCLIQIKDQHEFNFLICQENNLICMAL